MSEEIGRAGLCDDIQPAFAVILLVTAVGVMGDGGAYDVHGRAAPRHLDMIANFYPLDGEDYCSPEIVPVTKNSFQPLGTAVINRAYYADDTRSVCHSLLIWNGEAVVGFPGQDGNGRPNKRRDGI